MSKGASHANEQGGLPRLPSGRHGLRREFVVKNQRDRIAAGIVAVVAADGYHDTTIAKIAAAAGLSRRTFYSYFSSKEECFYDTYEAIVSHLIEVAREAGAAEPDWPLRVRAKVSAVLSAFSENPDVVRFLLIEPARAGQGIAAHQREAVVCAHDELLDGMPSPPDTREVSAAIATAIEGSGATLISRMVEDGEGHRLADLVPDMVEMILTPYLGREHAARVARQP